MIAFHAVISAYGFWLPNDPRGSWSDFVASWELFRYAGPATKVTTRCSLAHQPHDHQQRQCAKSSLKYPPVIFTGLQARSIARGLNQVAMDASYALLALAILPEHIHLAVGASARDPARVIGHLKRGATDQLIKDRVHPCSSGGPVTHSCWAERSWRVFIDSTDQLHQAIVYIENNPIKEGKSRQDWSFVNQSRQAFFAGRAARQAGRLTSSG